MDGNSITPIWGHSLFSKNTQNSLLVVKACTVYIWTAKLVIGRETKHHQHDGKCVTWMWNFTICLFVSCLLLVRTFTYSWCTWVSQNVQYMKISLYFCLWVAYSSYVLLRTFTYTWCTCVSQNVQYMKQAWFKLLPPNSSNFKIHTPNECFLGL